jgi:hypothetical protein
MKRLLLGGPERGRPRKRGNGSPALDELIAGSVAEIRILSGVQNFGLHFRFPEEDEQDEEEDQE